MLNELQKRRIQQDAKKYVEKLVSNYAGQPTEFFCYEWADDLANRLGYSAIMLRYQLSGNAQGWLEMLNLYETTCRATVKKLVTARRRVEEDNCGN